MSKGILLPSILFFLFTNLLLGQIQVSGVVYDGFTGEVLIGVAIVDANSGEGSVTDVNGNFELTVSENSVLQFSYLGYQTQEINVLTDKPLEILMQSDGIQLDKVVITGLGIKRQQRELGYSTENFSGNDIAISNAANVITALSGKSAGVNITNSNGVDGGTSRITIRGNNNITGNNQPLIIVDGVPLENPPGLNTIGRGTDWGSAINNINPEDIEDINILKGPTASAKYGMRGANGVILITTKKGKRRAGLGIEYTVSYKSIQPFRYREVQNIFGAGGPTSLLAPSFQQNAAGENVYPTNVHTSNGPFGRPTTEQFGFYSTGVSWGPEMQGQIVRWWDGELRTYDPQPDNLRLYFDNGQTTTHNINFSNGGDFGTVRVSMSLQDHDAVVPNSNFQQYTFNIGSDLNISEKLKSTISLSYVNFNRKNSPSLGDDNNASFGKGILYSWPRSYKGLEEDLNINPDGTQNSYDGNYPFTFSPNNLWWNTYNQNTYLTRNKFIGSVGLQYNILSWLNASANLGTDFNLNEFEEKFNPIDATGVNGAVYGNELDRNIVLNVDVLLTAQKEKIFNSPINVQWSIGGTQWHRDQYGINAKNSEWENPWLFSFNNAAGSIDQLPLANEIRYEKKINSIYSFLNLDYKDFLFLEVSGRNDWSSSLPLESNSYFYPSASLSYILTESFDLPIPWLSFMKLRASFAQTASDTDPFLLDFVYDTETFGGQQAATLPDTKPPTNLKPQQANSYELGLTLGILEDKVNIDFTYYYIESFDQILDSPVPTSSGASQIRINNGVLENYGYEVMVRANLYQWPGGYINTGFNLSHNRNFVKSLGDGAQFLEIGEIWGDFGPKIMVQEGEEYGTIYGYDYIYHENGQPILNDDGTHYQITENLVPVGNASPDFTGGWNLEVKYRNLSFHSLVDAKIGGEIYAGSYVIGLQTGQSPSTLDERLGNGLPYTDPSGQERNVGVILPGVYADGTPNTNVVHYYYKYLPNAGGWGKILTTPGILDNTWFKMRELAFSYDLSANQVSKLRLFQDLKVSLVGRDLFYFYSSIPDKINPEGTGGAGNAQGLEWASFPSMRSISLRLTANF